MLRWPNWRPISRDTRAPAGAGVAAERSVPGAQVSSQAQARRLGLLRRTDPAERSNGLVACAPRFSAEAQAGQARSRLFSADFANTTGDPAFDGTLRQIMAARTWEVALRQRASRCAHERDTAPDGPAGPDAKLTPDVASEICERTASAAVVEGSISKPRKPVRVGPARQELPDRRCSGRRAGAGSQKRGRLQGARPNGKPVPDPGRQVASAHGKGAQSAGRCNHAFTGGLEVLQRCNEGLSRRKAQSVEAVSLLKRAIEIDPQICDGLCLPGPAI